MLEMIENPMRSKKKCRSRRLNIREQRYERVDFLAGGRTGTMKKAKYGPKTDLPENALE